MKSFAAVAGYLATVQIDWSLDLAVTAVAVPGGILVLAQQLPPAWWPVLAIGAAGAVTAATVRRVPGRR